jgi:hypothetical protein
MDLKKYYLRNELVWRKLTEDEMAAFREKGVVEIEGREYSASPRISYFQNDNGAVEMYEVSDANIFGDSILNGVITPSGETGRNIGLNNLTMPLNVTYAVQALVSPNSYYVNNRFYTNIEDAIDYYRKIKDFVINR